MSDLHVGEGLFRPELLSAAVEEANELAPDLVVVAGDLTMEGYRGEFEQCRRFLDGLACAHVVVAMGNHDARNVGYRHFEDFFGSRDSVTTVELADGRARVVTIDSTKPDVDEGEVGREHYGWLDASLRGWTQGPRIVVIHHHILAVPGTGRDVNNLRDAGDFMAILRELEVDLVLSGHRHVPYVWSISGVRVVHSGTVSTLRVRGTMPPSYNVIEIDADEIRIVMRQPGQGAQGEEPLAHFARRPVTTSEFHPPLERFVRYAAVPAPPSDAASTPAPSLEAPGPGERPGRRSSPCSRAARWRAGASRPRSSRAARPGRSTSRPTTGPHAATASPSGLNPALPPSTPTCIPSDQGPCVRGDGFEHVRPRRERSRAHQAQAGLIEQLRELCLGALAPTRVREHDQIEQGGRQHGAARCHALRQEQLDDRQPRGLTHRGAATLQDGDASLVVPVVQDALEHVDVATRRDRREEVALHELAAIGDALLREISLGELEHPRPLDQHATRSRTVTQHLRQDGSRPTSDIDERPGVTQDIGLRELDGHGQGSRQHACRRARLHLRVRGVVLEQGSAEDGVERRLARADGMQQLAERAVHLLAEVDDHVAHAARRVGAQRRGRLVGREAAVLELGETPPATSARRRDGGPARARPPPPRRPPPTAALSSARRRRPASRRRTAPARAGSPGRSAAPSSSARSTSVGAQNVRRPAHDGVRSRARRSSLEKIAVTCFSTARSLRRAPRPSRRSTALRHQGQHLALTRLSTSSGSSRRRGRAAAPHLGRGPSRRLPRAARRR